MFIRPHDAGTDEAQWQDFVRQQGFGHFVVAGAGRVPVVVPTQFVLAGDQIIFHLANMNPVFEALEATPTAVLSVAGDWAYINGGWRADSDDDPSMGIPTTYYAAVQLIGQVEITDDVEEIAAILRIQIADLEADGSLQDPTVHAKRFPGIRGLRMNIDEVRSKFKYGANADTEHRARVAERLRARGGPGDMAAASRVPTD